jgi:hypothetical protein
LSRLGVDLPEPRLAVTAGGVAVYGFPVEPAQSGQVWQRLRSVHDRSGLWPFVSPQSPDDWRRDDYEASVSLSEALRADPQQVVADLIRAQREEAQESEARYPQLDGYSTGLFDPARVREALESTETDPLPAPAAVYRDVPESADWVCAVRAGAGYELPALLGAPSAANWYGSSHHPRLTPQDHVAVLRAWHDRYGAEVYYLGIVNVQLRVARPPVVVEEIVEVAVQQYAYCDDLGQRIGEPDRVARWQVPTANWRFWWD